ncbi:MarR family winged helix-turn-helix transcriptional regulator [Hyphomonas sp.]|uniref:MarR family winged helix-turn-helix transcriptional regulator n=1 Tax=Hyphomonas sp. TaxID=87 RepID=UPI00391BBA4A
MPRPPHASGLTDHLGFWMRMVSNQVSQAFAAKIEARGVTVAEWVLMRALYAQPPQSPSRLAETMGMTKGAVTKLADRLIAKSLLLRRPDPDDARAQTLALTAAGERLVPTLAAIADENDRAFFRALTSAERKALEKTLRRLASHHGKTSFPTS